MTHLLQDFEMVLDKENPNLENLNRWMERMQRSQYTNGCQKNEDRVSRDMTTSLALDASHSSHSSHCQRNQQLTSQFSGRPNRTLIFSTISTSSNSILTPNSSFT